MFSGALTALVTPFNPDGSLDISSFKKLVERQIKAGSDGVICAGTTGESCTLSDSEKIQLLEICLELAKGKIYVLLNTGTSSTQTTLQMTKKAKELGADGALVTVPYYNRPTVNGCIRHFEEVSSVGLPFIIYNNPGRTGVDLGIEAHLRLAALPFVVGFKESHKSVALVKELLEKARGAIVLSGDDDATHQMLKVGCHGAISVVGNIIPKMYKEYISLALEGKKKIAAELLEEFKALIEVLSLETNPQSVKYGCYVLGLCKSIYRLPMIEPQPVVKDKIEAVIRAMHLRQTQSLTEPV